MERTQTGGEGVMWMDFFMVIGRLLGSLISAGITIAIVLFVVNAVWDAIMRDDE